MEIGLGGRLDAVNLLDADVAVITPIGLDHQEYLGPDLESIGREKAGIIRPGQIVICGEAQPPHSVLAAAAEQGARVQRLGVDFRLQAQRRRRAFRDRRGGAGIAPAGLTRPAPVRQHGHRVGRRAGATAGGGS